MRDEATVLPAVKLAAQPMLQVEGVEGFEGGGLTDSRRCALSGDD